MKALLIAGLCALAAGCADIPRDITASDASFAKPGLTLAAMGVAPAQLVGHEQVVGEENHAAVLDGRS